MTKRWTMRRGLASMLSLASVFGCGKEPDRQSTTAASNKVPATYEVVLAGDSTRMDLLNSIASTHHSSVKAVENRIEFEFLYEQSTFRFTCATNASPEAQAGGFARADLVLLAVDATQGALPVHREHVILARQMAVPTLVVVFTKSSQIDDPELLELEELELRELLAKYDPPGNNAVCAFDHEAVKAGRGAKGPKGPRQVVHALNSVAKTRNQAKLDWEAKRFEASVYALATEEAFIRSVANPVTDGHTTVLIRGEKLAAEVKVSRNIAPGQKGNIEILFPKPIRAGQGQRFVLLHNQHVSATGVLLGVDGDR